MPGLSKHFSDIRVGGRIIHAGRRYEVTHFIGVENLLARDLETNESKRLRIETVVPVEIDAVKAVRQQKAARDLSSFSDAEWTQAQKRFEAIKPLLEDPIRSREAVEHLARKHGVHPATLYKWLADYQDANHISALVPGRRGRKFGSTLLDELQEHIITQAIEGTYLTKQRHRVQQVVDEVLRACRLSGIKAPSASAIRDRVRRVHPARALRRRGQADKARNRHEANIGSISGADRPLAVVMVDHTKADIILVDEINRRPIGRPWLTLAIDVYSRMVVGLYLTFEAPSATSVGLCLAHAMCTKREFLAELGVPGDWPVWGRPAVVHTDNGKEFRGNMIKRACEEYGIDLQWRPVMLPEYGGHIERLIGTVANEVHKLPGTTYSNPAARKGYDSDKHASMTLREFERHVVGFIVGIYHQRVHSELQMAPIRKWTVGITGDEHQPGTGIFPMPSSPLRVRLDFMPFFHRTVQVYGIQIDNISYYDPILDPYINAIEPDNRRAKRQFLIRRDPRDISVVYFLDPQTQEYAPIRYRNIGHAPISVWELQQAEETVRKQGRAEVNENTIFEMVEYLRAGVDAAIDSSKAARKRKQQRPRSSPLARPTPSPAVPHPVTPANTSMAPVPVPRTPAASARLFSTSIVPFDEVLLER